MNFQLTFSVQFSQFNEGDSSRESQLEIWVSVRRAGYGGWDCLYLIWDLTGFTSLAPSSCSMQGYIHLFYPAMSLYHTHSRTESPKLRSVIIIPIICKLELPFEREDCNCKVFIISQYEYLWWPGGIVYMCSYCLIFVYSELSGPQTQVRLPWCGVSRLKREICKLLTGPGVCRHHDASLPWGWTLFQL